MESPCECGIEPPSSISHGVSRNKCLQTLYYFVKPMIYSTSCYVSFNFLFWQEALLLSFIASFLQQKVSFKSLPVVWIISSPSLHFWREGCFCKFSNKLLGLFCKGFTSPLQYRGNKTKNFDSILTHDLQWVNPNLGLESTCLWSDELYYLVLKLGPRPGIPIQSKLPAKVQMFPNTYIYFVLTTM